MGRRSLIHACAKVLCVALLCVSAWAVELETPVELEAAVDRNEVQVADPFRLNISVTVPADAKVTFPLVPESLGSFQVISHQDFFDIPTDGDASQRLWKRTIELETYESGSLELPVLSIVVDGVSKSSKPIPITVQSLLESAADPTEFRELKDIEEIEVANINWRLWTLVATGIALLLGVVAWFTLGRRKRTQTPEAWVHQQLDELTNTLEFARRDQTFVLPRAADILRGFIQRKFSIAATQLTTDEFLTQFQSNPLLNESEKGDLRDFLRSTDEIKFAHLVPESDQLSATLDRVRTFVARSSESNDLAQHQEGTDHVVAR